jgi:RNA polymerase sigma-70 factor (ECF subfamily)
VTDNEAAAGEREAEELARRAVRRDADAWRAIFDAHYRTVYAFSRYRVGDAAEAEDVAAQVFEVAFARAEHFDYRGVPIEGWLIGIARNVCRDHIKKRARRGYTEDIEQTAGPSEPDASEAIGLRQDLAMAMGHLTDDQQEVLTLRFLLDRSVDETARTMRRSEDAVKNLQRRALAAMHRALADARYPGAER